MSEAEIRQHMDVTIIRYMQELWHICPSVGSKSDWFFEDRTTGEYFVRGPKERVGSRDEAIAFLKHHIETKAAFNGARAPVKTGPSIRELVEAADAATRLVNEAATPIYKVLMEELPPYGRIGAEAYWYLGEVSMNGEWVDVRADDVRDNDDYMWLVPVEVFDAGVDAVRAWAQEVSGKKADVERAKKEAELRKQIENLQNQLAGLHETNHANDPRPQNCRDRLREEGKAYPRSTCTACSSSIATGLSCRYGSKT